MMMQYENNVDTGVCKIIIKPAFGPCRTANGLGFIHTKYGNPACYMGFGNCMWIRLTMLLGSNNIPRQ